MTELLEGMRIIEAIEMIWAIALLALLGVLAIAINMAVVVTSDNPPNYGSKAAYRPAHPRPRGLAVRKDTTAPPPPPEGWTLEEVELYPPRTGAVPGSTYTMPMPPAYPSYDKIAKQGFISVMQTAREIYQRQEYYCTGCPLSCENGICMCCPDGYKDEDIEAFWRNVTDSLNKKENVDV